MRSRILQRSFGTRLVLLATVVCAGASGCAARSSTSGAQTVTLRESVATTMLHGKRLDLHIAIPTQVIRRDLLVVYASGDGGWFGSAVDQWRQIARAGYITAGFSSKSFLKIDRPAGAALNAARLADEYERIVQDAVHAVAWTEEPHVILAGWSRGAAFSVLAGTEPAFRGTLTGVVAIGLAEGEDLTIDGDGDDTDDGNAPAGEHQWPFDTYETLQKLPAPCAVIQATHDNYFPAAQARQRFGPDTATRHFYQIDAKNHRFSGGAAAFNSALIEALHWLAKDVKAAS